MGGCCSAPFWLSVLCAALMPTSIGHQDLATALAQPPHAAARQHDHLIASPFGTIEAATFSFSRPIGTAMPDPRLYQQVNFDPRTADATWKLDEPLMTGTATQIEYPTVNRRLKGDRLPSSDGAPAPGEPQSLPKLKPIDAAPADAAPAQPAAPAVQPRAPAATPRPKDAEGNDAAPPDPSLEVFNDGSASRQPAAPSVDDAANDVQSGTVPPPEHANARGGLVEDVVALADGPPEIPAPGDADDSEASPSTIAALSFLDEDPAMDRTQLYFSGGAMGHPVGLERWSPGSEPMAVSPGVDSEIKLTALEAVPADADSGGETVAGKDDAKRLESPAERLGLLDKPRVKAEKCLADAVYFEARGEPLKGQQAVAQVVMNRVFSGYYPHDVCGVVYQNASRHLACQFTFACEGKDLSRIDEQDMWEQAKRISKDTLDGKIYLAEVGHATHYHAYWVHPSWVHEMTKLYKLGVHTFYRPRAWGDGNDTPTWGVGPTSKADGPADQPADAAKDPETTASTPARPAVKSEPTAKL